MADPDPPRRRCAVKRRRLGAEERALWERVRRTVAPLRPLPEPPPPPPPAEPPPAAAELPAAERPPPAPSAVKTPHPPRPPGNLDGQTRRKIPRGAVAIDGRIDLHGMRQDEAHAALLRFIEASAAMRRRVVLVITGKGSGGDGVLRRSVPHWLAVGGTARLIVSFGPAHPNHGGDGALYVRLRQPRR